ncbi:peptidylprolyl isomerase [Paenibacillus sp. GCM10027628]|uniref:peptidylprolyl isomerase n=1 Tax=Paenibacillus sp. GCM10027628 TaxID=3273413 RepID=UPI0036457409
MAGKRSIYKHKLFQGALLAAVLISCAISVYFFMRQPELKATETAASVNNEPISVMELRDTMIRLKASVFMEFSKKHDYIDNDAFWDSSIDGQNPLAVLRETALKEIVQRKVKLSLDKKYELISDTDYASIQKGLYSENSDRKSKVEKKETIYGPQKIDLMQYYTVLDSKNDDVVTKHLEEEKIIDVSDDNLKQYYEEIKAKNYKLPDKIKILKIELRFANGDTDLSEDEAGKRIQEAVKSLTNGESFETVAKAFNKDGSLSTYTFEPDHFPKRDRTLLKIFDAAQALKPGEISKAFQTDSTFEIIKVVDKEDSGYSAFSDVKESVKENLERAKLDQYIRTLSDSAVIKKNEAVFDRVTF